MKCWFISAATRARGQSNDLNREILASSLFNCHKEVINAPPVPSISRCIHIVYRHKNVWQYQWSNFIYNCMSTFLHYVRCKDALLDCSAPGGEMYESLTWVDEIVTTGDISMIPSFEIWSYMLLELLHCYPVGIYAESNHRNKLWMELKPHWFKNALARNGFPGTCTKFMMTSSNGNIFCVTFPLWHVCSGFLGTLKIREFLKMALEK